MASNEDGGFWSKVENQKKDERDALARNDTKPKRRWGRILAFAAGGVVVVVAGLVVLAPTIAGGLVPGMVPGIASGAMNGSASIDSASFSWGGPQLVRGVKVVDKAGKTVATVRDIELSAGLLGLITGNLDVGSVTISGVKADIVKNADGTTNVQGLAKPAPAGSGSSGASSSSSSPSPVPEGIKAKLVLKNVEATYTDVSGADGKPRVVALEGFDATGSFDSRDAIKVKATGSARGDSAKLGSISIDAVIDSWVSKSGKVTPDAATVEATVDIKNLPSALLDAVAPGALAGGSFREGLGETADVNVVASGSMSGGKAQIVAKSANLNVDAKVTVAANVLTSDAPIRVQVTGAGIAGLSPAAKAALKQQNISFDALPDAAITIDQVRLALPQGGAPLNLKGGGAMISASLTEMRGMVTLQEQGAPQPFRIAPLTATVDAKDLSGTVRLAAATQAQINGNDAGNLNADVSVQGLLDPSGQPVKGMPGNVQGDISLKGVATAIAQPFVQAFKLNLPEDLGPTLDANIKLASNLSAAPAGGTAPADLDISIESKNLSVTGGVRYAKDRITAREGGLRVTSRKPSALANHFMDPALGYSLSPSRSDSRGMTLLVKKLDVPMNAAGKPDASKLAADIDVAIEGLSVVPMVGGTAASPLDIAALAVSLSVGGATPGSVRGTITSSLWHENAPFGMTGTFDVASMLVNGKDGNIAVATDTMRPVADIQLKDVPVSIAKLGEAGKPVPQGPVLDLVKLLKGVVGDTFTVALGAKGVEGAQGAYDMKVAMRSSRVNADVDARSSQQSIELRTLGAKATVAPETVRSLLAAFAPDVTGVPQLVSASTLTLAMDPLTIPFKSDKSLDLAAVGMANVKLMLPGRTLVSGLTRTGPDGRPVDLGVVGVEELSITASAPVAGLVGSAAPGKRGAKVKMGGTILGGADGATAIAVLDGDITTEVSNKTLAGPLAAKISLTKVNVVALERMVGQEGKVSGAIGDKATMELSADVQPPAEGQAGQPFDFAQATTTVNVALDAPRLKSDGPLSATMSPMAIKLNKPSRFTLAADPAFVNAFLKPVPVAGAAPVAPALVVREMTPVTVTLDKLNFPLKGATGAAAKLEAGLALAIQSISMQTADGKPLRLSGTDIGITSQQPGPKGTNVDFRFVVAEVATGAGGEGETSKNMNMKGTIEGIIDAAGVVDPSKAVVNVQADMPKIPTPLIDAFTTRDGTVVDALGPIAALKLDVQRFPVSGKPAEGTQPPVVEMVATSNRATASLKGTVRDGMYVGIDPFKARITEVTQQLSARFIKALPLMGTFEKTAQDQPATVDVTGITAALGNDMSKLNADVVFDPGEARFGTSSAFSELLKIVNSKTEGQMGKKLDPMKMQVRNGVATYERWKVPVGEFTISTEGTVDLVRRTLDVVTYVPIGAVSDKAMAGLKTGSSLNSILGGAAEALTEVPFRTTGSMDNPKTAVDPELMAKNAVKGLNPEKILKDGLQDLLKPKAPKPTVPVAPK